MVKTKSGTRAYYHDAGLMVLADEYERLVALTDNLIRYVEFFDENYHRVSEVSGFKSIVKSIRARKETAIPQPKTVH